MLLHFFYGCTHSDLRRIHRHATLNDTTTTQKFTVLGTERSAALSARCTGNFEHPANQMMGWRLR